jgi:hypothetical protein
MAVTGELPLPSEAPELTFDFGENDAFFSSLPGVGSRNWPNNLGYLADAEVYLADALRELRRTTDGTPSQLAEDEIWKALVRPSNVAKVMMHCTQQNKFKRGGT